MDDADEFSNLQYAATAWHDALTDAYEAREELAIEIVGAFEDGLSLRAIAELTGIHRNTVRKMLAEQHVI